MKTMKRLNYENMLHIVIIATAIFLRFYALGNAPLSDLEATWALQARNVALRSPGNIGPQPAYVILTSMLFYIFNDTTFLARLLPALLGGLLVGAPYLFRHRLGRIPALIIAVGLAFDPGMLAVSRLAGGPILTLAFPALAAGMVAAGMPILGGVLAGMALLAGSSLWALLIPVVLTLAWLQLTTGTRLQLLDFDIRVFLRQINPGRSGLLAALLTFLVVGTGFSFTPAGLSAFGNSAPAYFAGWFSATGIPFSRMLAAYTLYNPLAFVFAFVGIVAAWWSGSNRHRVAILWWVFSLLVVFAYPSRQAPDLIFVIVPTWVLAGLGLSQLARRGEHGFIAVGQAGLLSVLGIMCYLAFASFSSLNMTGIPLQTWGFLLAIFGLAMATTVLVGMGWSWKDAALGFGWGLIVVLIIPLLATTIRVGYLKHNDASELWYPAPTVGETDLLLETIGEFGAKSSGRADTLDMAVFFDVPSMRWALRNIHGVDFYLNPLDVSDKDAVLTLARDDSLVQQELYQGQSFAWWDYPGWDGGLPPDWWRWLTFREAPLVTDEVILWVKADLYAGSVE